MHMYVHVCVDVHVYVGMYVYKINITGSASLAELRIPHEALTPVEEYRVDTIFAMRNVVFCAGRRRDGSIQEGKRREGTVR